MIRGLVLWYDGRDKYGIIEGDDGNEYYFDVSVIKTDFPIMNKTRVTFIKNDKITDCLCARDVNKEEVNG